MRTVPVLIYHKITKRYIKGDDLSCPVDLFQKQMEYLHKNHFKTLFINEVYNHLKFNNHLEKRSLAITFDDGYLDNWVFAFPVLKKYSLKATIFVTTDFITDNAECRFNQENVWKREISKEDLKLNGYISWKEAIEMLNSGLIDIQSHGKTHKPFSKMVKDSSKEENVEEIFFELHESRRILEENLQRKILFLAWPHGHWISIAQNIAIKNVGYSATIITKEMKNLFGQNPEMIGRIYFGQTYNGFWPEFVRYIKFISAIEKRCGCGIKHTIFKIGGIKNFMKRNEKN